MITFSSKSSHQKTNFEKIRKTGYKETALNFIYRLKWSKYTRKRANNALELTGLSRVEFETGFGSIGGLPTKVAPQSRPANQLHRSAHNRYIYGFDPTICSLWGWLQIPYTPFPQDYPFILPNIVLHPYNQTAPCPARSL
jgi:hypothetical protein